MIDLLKEHQQALQQVMAQHGVELVYLYGSQARGDAGPLSDVDIAVLFSTEILKAERFEHPPVG